MDDDRDYSDVHIGPDSDDEYNENQFDQNSSEPHDNEPRQQCRRQFVSPETSQTIYYDMVTKNLDPTKAMIKRFLNTCTNLRFEPDGQQPLFLSEPVSKAYCGVWDARN